MVFDTDKWTRQQNKGQFRRSIHGVYTSNQLIGWKRGEASSNAVPASRHATQKMQFVACLIQLNDCEPSTSSESTDLLIASTGKPN